jgi:hypothetical protein
MLVLSRKLGQRILVPDCELMFCLSRIWKIAPFELV